MYTFVAIFLFYWGLLLLSQARQILEREFGKLTALCPERLAHTDAKSDVSRMLVYSSSISCCKCVE